VAKAAGINSRHIAPSTSLLCPLQAVPSGRAKRQRQARLVEEVLLVALLGWRRHSPFFSLLFFIFYFLFSLMTSGNFFVYIFKSFSWEE
jgi:hypothetical protein